MPEKGYVRVMDKLGRTLAVTQDWQIIPDNVDYIIFRDGDLIKAKNGRTGKVDFKGTAGIDDVSVINQAISKGNSIFILPGEYDITEPIVITKSNIILAGAGWSTILNQKNDYNCFKLVGAENVTIKDLFIDAQYTTNPTNNKVIEIARSKHVLIDRIKISKAPGFGIYMHANDAGDTIDITVRDSYLTGTGNNDVIGGGVDKGTTGLLSNITIENNYIIQGATRTGTYGQGITLNRVKRVQIINNKLRGGISFSGENTPNQYSRITGNLIEPAYNDVTPKIEIVSGDNGAYFILVSQNIITGGKINVIGTSEDATKIILLGNIVNASGLSEAIYLTRVSIGSIIGNVLQGSEKSILLDASSKMLITSNTFMFSQYAVYEQNGSFRNKVAFNFLQGVKNGIYLTGEESEAFGNYGWRTENHGTAAINADGTKTQFSIAHRLVSTPSYVNVIPKGGAPQPDSIDADSSNITLTFTTAPAEGTYYYWWEARV